MKAADQINNMVIQYRRYRELGDSHEQATARIAPYNLNGSQWIWKRFYQAIA
jgi:hypothetical protein